MYKYDYVIFKNNGKYEFVNLKTGNVSYKIDNTINAVIEDAQNKIVYMTCYDTKGKNFVIYNSNGKLLFDGEKFNKMIVGNGNLIVATQTAYRVYDSKLRLKTSSKTYDKILELYDEFIVIIKDNKLSLVDISDNLLTTFDLEWDSDKYSFDYILSGPNTYDGKNVFSAVLVNYDIPDGVNGHVLYYYYVPTTKETGVVESSVVSYPGVVY